MTTRGFFLLLGRISVAIGFIYLIVAYTPMGKIVRAGSPTGAGTLWNSTYENNPTGADNLNEGDDWINQTKLDTRGRMAVEHDFGNLDGSPTTDTGRHLEGSARTFFDAAAPTTIPRSAGDFDNNDGTGVSTALDEGRLWIDSDTDFLSYYDGAGWEPVIPNIHASNHRLTGAAPWVDALDGIPFAIQQIARDSSVKAACLTNVFTAALSTQNFGDAGDACLSVALPMTGRVADSRVLVIATVMFYDNGTATSCGSVTGGIYFGLLGDGVADVSTTTLISDLITNIDPPTSSSDYGQVTMIGYTTVATGISNEFAIHFFGDTSSCALIDGDMIVVDLGNS